MTVGFIFTIAVLVAALLLALLSAILTAVQSWRARRQGKP
jgi:hypothetical protein